MTTQAAPHATAARRPRVLARGLSVMAATAAAVMVWLVAKPLLSIDLLVRPEGGAAQQVGAGAVIAVSLAVSLLGWGLMALLERRTPRVRTIWTGIAVAVLLVSLAGPLASTSAASTKTVLVLMHITVAAVLIPAMRHTLPPQTTGSGRAEEEDDR